MRMPWPGRGEVWREGMPWAKGAGILETKKRNAMAGGEGGVGNTQTNKPEGGG